MPARLLLLALFSKYPDIKAAQKLGIMHPRLRPKCSKRGPALHVFRFEFDSRSALRSRRSKQSILSPTLGKPLGFARYVHYLGLRRTPDPSYQNFQRGLKAPEPGHPWSPTALHV